MSDSEEVPAYVTYTNGIVKEALDGVSDQIARMAAELATKSDVTLLEYKLGVETQARIDQIAELVKQVAALVAAVAADKAAREAQRKADEAERKAKGRRIWGVLLTITGIVVTTFGGLVFQYWTQTH